MGKEINQSELDSLITQLQVVEKLKPVLDAMIKRIDELEKEVSKLKNGNR